MIVVRSGFVTGIEAFLIDVEVDVRPGLPGFEIVGLPSATVRESRERVRSALRNSGYKFPAQKVVVNLAPAHYKKDGALFDLPIALGILGHLGLFNPVLLKQKIFVGELSLNGNIKGINGILSLAELGLKHDLPLIIPFENKKESGLLVNQTCFLADNLSSIVNYLQGRGTLQKARVRELPKSKKNVDGVVILGQDQAKRALEIAARGPHHIMLLGPPGVGKTLLAKQAIHLLPPLTREEIITLNQIYEAAGLTAGFEQLIWERPLRSPHHSISQSALIGGRSGRPGEITLAHSGILLLDEFPEFNQGALQSLREPLDHKKVHISRADHTLSYPADFWLIATANPCPCGYFGSRERLCTCSSRDLNRYRRKLRGPLIDRFELFCYLPPLTELELQAKSGSWPEVSQYFVNSGQEKRIKISPKAEKLLLQAQKNLTLSVRAFHNTLKVAQTIAKLDGLATVEEAQIGEALQYRLETMQEFLY